MDTKEIWEHSLSYIRQEINSQVGYNTYIKDAKPISLENGVFKISVSTPLIKNMILLRYRRNIEDSLSRITTRQTVLDIVTDGEEISANISRAAGNNAVNLNPKYTFENFVVGSSNRHAATLAKKVAELP